MRNMSFMLTTRQMRDRTKTVTRRMGWDNAKVGELLCAVEKCQGLKKGEKIVRICVVRVLSVRKEPLQRMLDDPKYGHEETAKEGFGGRPHGWFVDHFCRSMRVTPAAKPNRIEFEYV